MLFIQSFLSYINVFCILVSYIIFICINWIDYANMGKNNIVQRCFKYYILDIISQNG